jgi:hypothetical protein
VKELCLAPGVEFDKDAHEYTYKGKPLSGITGKVCKRLGLKYGGSKVNAKRIAGSNAHDAIEEWIKSGGLRCTTMNLGVVWMTKTLLDKVSDVVAVFSEVLVSDKKIYASAVDVILQHSNRTDLTIADAKNGVFKREYLEWQLGIYKYLIEKYTTYKVKTCLCIALKERMYYKITPRDTRAVEELLYGEDICQTRRRSSGLSKRNVAELKTTRSEKTIVSCERIEPQTGKARSSGQKRKST